MKRTSYQGFLKLFFVGMAFLTFISCKKDDLQNNTELSNVALVDPLPQINISTFGNQILDEPKVDAQMTISFKDEELHS